MSLEKSILDINKINSILSSEYGYKEYLIKKSDNKEALLDFAFWRTDICREIYRKAKDISEAITSI